MELEDSIHVGVWNGMGVLGKTQYYQETRMMSLVWPY